MAEGSNIEWCDHTWNPWEGCQKVGPGCDNCYAEARNQRFAGGANWGPGAPRRKTSDATWSMPFKWNRGADKFALEHGRRQRIFCASLADLFDNAVPLDWLFEALIIMADCSQLNWLPLTKRVGNVEDRVTSGWLQRWPANVGLMITVVNQEEADRDIPKLLALKARLGIPWVGISYEPALGSLNLRPWLHLIDWVIAGGESGPNARPAHPDWFRAVRDQCEVAGTAFLFKQWGEWTPGENVEAQHGTVQTAHRFADKWIFDTENLAWTDGHVDDQPDLYRIGKKRAARHLDGKIHNQFPAALAA